MQYTKMIRIDAMSRLFAVLQDDDRVEDFIGLLQDLAEEDDVRAICVFEDILTEMLYPEVHDED